MRVLLISPVKNIDPHCGDITYTETLMAHPPQGVVYETYDQALRQGTLIEHARRKRLSHEPFLTIANKSINVLRKWHWLFWEPFRFFSIQPDIYDLVHVHVFSVRFLALPCPLILSCGAPQSDLYTDRRHYKQGRVKKMEWIERNLGKALGVNCNSSFMPQIQQTIVYTEYFRDYLTSREYVEADKIKVVPIMSEESNLPLVRRHPKRIGFVANDFYLKGGGVLLDSFNKVRTERPDAELWIVGSEPKLSKEKSDALGIKWIPHVQREVLLSEIMPSFDVFAYPTPHDCFSYVMLEAMSCGAAIATSDYISMPEAVDYGRAGLISPVGDANKLAKNILKLLDPDTNWHFRQAARKRFLDYFSVTSVSPRLLSVYEQAIKQNIRFASMVGVK